LPHGAGCDPVILDGYINARYREILDKFDWSRLVKTSTIQTVAPYDTGTVAVVEGSNAVTGSGTTWTAAMTGRQFRAAGRSEFYAFTRTGNTTGTLDRVYEGDDASGVGYKIFQPYYALPSDLRVLESIKVPQAGRDLDQRNREWLDMLDPSREIFGEPELWAPYDDDSTPLPQIELYPIPIRAEGLPIRYLTAKARLAATTDVLPEWMNEECLIAGVEWNLYTLTGDLASAGEKKSEFYTTLQDQMRLETRRTVPEQMRMAPRFTSHRRARVWGNDDDDELEILRRS
jgi:hypothetical protein